MAQRIESSDNSEIKAKLKSKNSEFKKSARNFTKKIQNKVEEVTCRAEVGMSFA